MAIRWGRDRNIPCQRPGCRNVLPNIRALTSHLTLHDIDPVERYATTRSVRSRSNDSYTLYDADTSRSHLTTHSSTCVRPVEHGSGGGMPLLQPLMPILCGNDVSYCYCCLANTPY